MLSLTRAAVKEIEDRGFRVRGYHDAIAEKEIEDHDAINEGPAPLVLTATDTSTGKIYKVRREDGDEYKAVIELTKLIGADPEVPRGTLQ